MSGRVAVSLLCCVLAAPAGFLVGSAGALFVCAIVGGAVASSGVVLICWAEGRQTRYRARTTAFVADQLGPYFAEEDALIRARQRAARERYVTRVVVPSVFEMLPDAEPTPATPLRVVR